MGRTDEDGKEESRVGAGLRGGDCEWTKGEREGLHGVAVVAKDRGSSTGEEEGCGWDFTEGIRKSLVYWKNAGGRVEWNDVGWIWGRKEIFYLDGERFVWKFFDDKFTWV